MWWLGTRCHEAYRERKERQEANGNVNAPVNRRPPSQSNDRRGNDDEEFEQQSAEIRAVREHCRLLYGDEDTTDRRFGANT